MTKLIVQPSQFVCPVLIAAAGDRAQIRFLEFFASNIRNPHTRRAYVRAVTEFLDWCAVAAGVSSLIDIEPLHVAALIEGKTRQVSAPTVKQHLAAIRHLFDWLVTGQIVRRSIPLHRYEVHHMW
jgi:site-specific recombinase XerD